MTSVLGIDPGLGVTGYALVRRGPPARLVEAGVVRTRPSDDLAVRVCTIQTAIEEALDELEPDLVALEALYSDYRHPASALQMAHARGVVCAAAARRGITVRDYAARDVKMAIVGIGSASKEQVRRMVQKMLSVPDGRYPLDVSDAMAVALTCLHRMKTEDRRP
jgi:crossover junction endodeoxyribonuclease RuvC